jgi:hypothetical protein
MTIGNIGLNTLKKVFQVGKESLSGGNVNLRNTARSFVPAIPSQVKPCSSLSGIIQGCVKVRVHFCLILTSFFGSTNMERPSRNRIVEKRLF